MQRHRVYFIVSFCVKQHVTLVPNVFTAAQHTHRRMPHSSMSRCAWRMISLFCAVYRLLATACQRLAIVIQFNEELQKIGNVLWAHAFQLDHVKFENICKQSVNSKTLEAKVNREKMWRKERYGNSIGLRTWVCKSITQWMVLISEHSQFTSRWMNSVCSVLTAAGLAITRISTFYGQCWKVLSFSRSFFFLSTKSVLKWKMNRQI